jgi:methyl-accepting chemotaxis protein
MNFSTIVRDAKLRTKLFAIAIVPLLGLSYFAGQIVSERRANAAEVARLGALVELSVRIGSLVHETQRERGMTSLYVSGAGRTFQFELESQRRETDRRLIAYREFLEQNAGTLSEGVRHELSAAQNELVRLEDTRARASRLAGEAKEFFRYYSSLNELLLSSIASITSETSSADLTRTSYAYLALLRAKEHAGMERAQLVAVFVNKGFAPGQSSAVSGLIAKQDAYLHDFTDLAPPQISAEFREKARGPAFARVKEFERTALESDPAHVPTVEPKVWFETATAKIDGLKEIEEATVRALTKRVDSDRSAADRAVLVALLLWLGITGLAIAQTLVLVRRITAPVARALRVLAAVADGDLSQKLEVESKDEIGQITLALNNAVDGVRAAIGEARQVAMDVAAASAQLSSASEDISSGAQEQAASLEETAGTLEQITSTVKQNADNARHAADLASKSRDVAERGGQVAAHAVRAMDEITEGSKRIADIIGTVDEIAFQTNLLALNAAVEAARAGDQGRGFAAVAAEVRTLAQRSAAAAKEIKSLIGASVTKINSGSQHVNDTGRSLEDIVTSFKRVTDMVGEIAAASREQNIGIEQVNKAVAQMDHVTQANAAQTEEMSSTAASLADQARQLGTMVARFRLDDDDSSPALPTPAPKPAKKVNAPAESTRLKTNGLRATAPARRPRVDTSFEEF